MEQVAQEAIAEEQGSPQAADTPQDTPESNADRALDSAFSLDAVMGAADPQRRQEPPRERVPAPSANGQQQDAPAQQQGDQAQQKPGSEAVTEEAQVEQADDLRTLMFGEPSGKPAEIPDAVKTWAEQSGYTVEDIQGIPAVREQLAEATKKATEFDQWTERVESLPLPFKTALAKAMKGDDTWRADLMNAPDGVNLSQPFSKQDAKTVLNALAPGEIDEETWEAAKDGDEGAKKQVSLAMKLVQAKFNDLKDGYESYINDQTAAAQQYQERLKTSAEASIANLQRLMPRVSPLIPEIKKSLSPEGVRDMFFTEDGALRPDAARYVALVKYSKQLYDAKVGAAAKEAKDAAELDVLNRTPERATTQGKGASGQQRTLPPKVAADEMIADFMTGKTLFKQ